MLKATNISAVEAKKIKYLSTQAALISINIPEEPLHELQIDRKSSHVLTVSFYDITGKMTVAGDTIMPMDGETAKNIVEFIHNYSKKNFIVHCAAGISRSAAVCMFIHLIYGHKLKENFWQLSHPNPYVLGKLILLHEQLFKK